MGLSALLSQPAPFCSSSLDFQVLISTPHAGGLHNGDSWRSTRANLHAQQCPDHEWVGAHGLDVVGVYIGPSNGYSMAGACCAILFIGHREHFRMC